MTDEEKAEEYLKEICPICNDREACLEDGCNCYIKEAYFDGLAEGRKEEQEKTCYCKHIQNFEKENAELEKDKEWLDNTNNEQTKVIIDLQEQIDQLSNDNHVLKTAFITQNEQIEKMKCCGNCKYSQYISCPNVRQCSNYSKWELAE